MPEQNSISNLLGSTAHWTAAVRQMESAREDRLFNDPWAAALAGDQGAQWIAQRTPDSVAPIVLRTRYFDDFLQRVTAQHGIRQVVLLAAGLDTRAFRLPWPAETRIFELDQVAVLAHKERVLRAAGAECPCARQTAGVDLTDSWSTALNAAGFDPERPSCWLLEGFLFYVCNEDIVQIIDAVSRLAAPGSWLGFDIVNTITLTSPWTKAWIDMQAKSGAPWIGAMDDPVSFLAERGWTATLSQPGQPDANHGRWKLPVIPTTMPGMPHNWYVTAQKT
jgi:methyltransferase (TIGR00027 family)